MRPFRSRATTACGTATKIARACPAGHPNRPSGALPTVQCDRPAYSRIAARPRSPATRAAKPAFAVSEITPSGNDGYLREPGGWSRREAVIAEGDGADVDDRQIATVSLTSHRQGIARSPASATISPPRSPLRYASRVVCAITSRAPASLHRSTWLIKGLSKHADCWIIVLVKRRVVQDCSAWKIRSEC